SERGGRRPDYLFLPILELYECRTLSAVKTKMPSSTVNAESLRVSGIRRQSHLASLRAFSLIEIMVVVVLLSVIILGLMAMFNQTQRAFKLGMNQTDVLEAGRVGTDLIVREMEQLTP